MKDLKSMKAVMAQTLRNAPDVQTDRMKRLQMICRACESPIEKDLATAILDHQALNADGAPTIYTKTEMLDGVGELLICPQFRVADYRIDFALVIEGGRRLAIECDGIEWHDRTSQQFMAERQRQRDLLIQGWPMMRFTGAEIMRDPDSCASEIAQYLLGGFK